MGRRRDFLPISDLLSDLTAGIRPQTTLARVQSAWPQAVGETIASWATPLSERAGVVTFACSDSLVAHELEMIKLELLEKLAAELPEGAPTELRFVIR
jgi:predicted nucleic acid-binding Zn ribbon protein